MAFETTTQLVQEVEFMMGEPTDGTSAQRTRILNRLDDAHKEIVSGGGILNIGNRGNVERDPVVFPWAKSKTRLVVNTEAPITTGTVSINKSSTALTFTSGPAASVADYFIRIANQPEVYRISAHTAASTSATLDGGFIGDNITGAEYEVFRLFYTFGTGNGLLLPLSPLLLSGFWRVNITSEKSLEAAFPLHLVQKDLPQLATVVKQDATTITIRLSHYTNDIERMELEFVPIPSTLDLVSSDPVIPKHRRKILSHLTAYYMLRDNDDTRAQSHLSDAKNLFEALVNEKNQFESGNDEGFGDTRTRSRYFARTRITKLIDGNSDV